MLYVDDDSEHQAYEKVISQLVEEHGNSSISLTIGPSVGVLRAANKLAELTTVDIFMTANDNQVYINEGWDVPLDAEIENIQMAFSACMSNINALGTY